MRQRLGANQRAKRRDFGRVATYGSLTINEGHTVLSVVRQTRSDYYCFVLLKDNWCLRVVRPYRGREFLRVLEASIWLKQEVCQAHTFSCVTQ